MHPSFIKNPYRDFCEFEAVAFPKSKSFASIFVRGLGHWKMVIK